MANPILHPLQKTVIELEKSIKRLQYLGYEEVVADLKVLKDKVEGLQK